MALAFRVGNLRGYADFSHQRPPRSLFVLLIPRLFTSDPQAYAILLDMIAPWASSKIGTKPLAPNGVSLLLFWRLPYIRHDLVPIAAVTLGTLFRCGIGRF